MRCKLFWALSALLLAASAFAADDPFTGTWKLNVTKSKFSPGPPPRGETVTIAQDMVTVEETAADGTALKWSYPVGGTGPATITGFPDSNVVETRQGNTVQHTWKWGKGSMTGRGVLSKDGKTMNYTLRGTDDKGKKVMNHEVYEKQ